MHATPKLLADDDFCARRAFYAQRWTPPALRPKEILTQSIEFGLMSKAADPGDVAEAESLRLCTEVGIDTEQQDLLSLATHIGALANFVTWLLRSSHTPYKRPDPIALPGGSLWTSSAFLSANERSLRSVVVVDRWDAWAQTALENSWAVRGECAAYAVPMSIIVVEVGQLRKGRWTNPFTAAWRHPVAKNLRFVKRNGESFGVTWESVRRETDKATRQEWLDAMSDDGVLAENLHVHTVELAQIETRLHLAESKLDRIQSASKPPEPQFSMCFSRINPCPFRATCPRGEEPSPELGFVALHDSA